MTFSGVDSIVLLIGSVLLGAAIATAMILLKRTAERQREEFQAIGAAAQLQAWRHNGLLVMSDKDFQLALELGKEIPKQLEHLVSAISRLIDEEELEPNEVIKLTVRVEHKSELEHPPKATSSKGHLELITEFA